MIFSIGETIPDQLNVKTFKPTSTGVIVDFHKGEQDVFYIIRIGDDIMKDEKYQDEFSEKITNLVIDEIKRTLKAPLKELTRVKNLTDKQGK